MKIVVIGGSGLIGSKLVAKLRERGHETLAASPDTGVNTLTGQGLAAAVEGASVVTDVSNSPSFEDAAVLNFFETSTRNLLAAESAAGVAHHAALSVVGTDRLPDSGYLRAKLAQEKLIEHSTIPYSIVHATQFFEFINGIADAATSGNTVRLAHVLIQPMAAEDVASAVADVTVGPPVNGITEIAGPQRFHLDELVQNTLRERHDPREVITNAGVGDPEVRALVYVDAFIPDQGDTIGKLASGSCLGADSFNPVPYPGGPPGDVDLYIKPSVVPGCFATGLPASQAAVIAATQRPLAASAFNEPSGPPAWKTIPSWAVIGTGDRVIPPATLTFMAQRAGPTSPTSTPGTCPSSPSRRS
jgi:uncharacterized protein YbjT (DUF2867 family)